MYLVIFPYHMKPKARNVRGDDTSKPESGTKPTLVLQTSRSTKDARRGSANYQNLGGNIDGVGKYGIL